jgi:hypothetical protein
MSLKTRANAQAGTPERRSDQRCSLAGDRPTVWLKAWRRSLCAAAFSLAAISSALAAETPALLLEIASPAPVLAYASLSTAPTMASLWLSAGSTATDGLLDLRAAERQTSSLLRWQTEPGDLAFPSSLLVAPPKIDSRFSYLSWAALHTGVGEYFLSDTLPRLRTNGAGIQNPRWFFLKLSFRL